MSFQQKKMASNRVEPVETYLDWVQLTVGTRPVFGAVGWRWSWSCFGGESTLPPTAARRWTKEKSSVPFHRQTS